MLLGFIDGVFDLLQILSLIEPIENFLRSGLDTIHQQGTVGFAHHGYLIEGDRVNPSFAPPVKLKVTFDNAVADGIDTLAV